MNKNFLLVAMFAGLVAGSSSAFAQTQAEMDAVAKIMKEPQTKTSTLSFLGEYHFVREEYTQAAERYRQLTALYASDPALGVKSAKYAWGLTRVADCEEKLGHKTEAVELCKSALSAIEGQTERNNPYDSEYLRHTQDTCDRIMQVYVPRNNDEKVDSIDLDSKSAGAFREVPEAYKSWYQNLHMGMLSRRENKPADAEHYFLLSLEESERLNLHAAPTCLSLLGLAVTYYGEKQYNKAVPAFRRAVSAMESWEGANSKRLIPVLAEYSEALKRSGDLAGAAAARKRMDDLIAGTNSVDTSGDWRTLSTKEVKALRARQFDTAEELAKAACRVAPSDSIDAQAMSMIALGHAQEAAHHFNQAEITFNSLLLQFKDYPKHSKSQETMAYIGLAQAQAENGKVAAAERNLAVADKQIFDFVAKNRADFYRREQLLALYYLAKAAVAKAKGEIAKYQEFMELGREAVMKSR